MNPKIELTLLACALGAASVATAQTSNDIPPPNDIIRLPGNVTTPNMPVVVSPPRDDFGRGTATGSPNGASRQALPVVRSLGSNSTQSNDAMSNDTLSDGVATGGAVGTPVNGTATNGMAGQAPTPSVNGATSSAGLNGGITPSSRGSAGIFDSGSKPSDHAGQASAATTDTNAVPAGSNPNGGETGATMGDQNNQPGNSTKAPAGQVPAGRPGIPRSSGAASSQGASGGK